MNTFPSYCDFCGGKLVQTDRPGRVFDTFNGQPIRVTIITIRCMMYEPNSQHYFQQIIERPTQLGEFHARP